MVPVPEGQIIVACPYCEMRSFVRGERGLQRYQVPKRVERPSGAAKIFEREFRYCGGCGSKIHFAGKFFGLFTLLG
jgi:hypothetical protein